LKDYKPNYIKTLKFRPKKKRFFIKKNFKFVKKNQQKFGFFFQIPITFFGAGCRDSEQNKKDAPKHQLSIFVFKILRTL
jgi:hypothetical protein